MKCLPVSFFLVSVSLFTAGCGEIKRIQIIEENCGKCHSADRIYSMNETPAEWDRIVYGMKRRGLEMSRDTETELMQILYTEFGSDK